MEECCDICGFSGVAEALITCSQCKINCEHMYCMKSVLTEPINDWCCEECKSSSKPKTPASFLNGKLPGASKLTNSVEVLNGDKLHTESRKLLNESRKGGSGSINWEKKVSTGKTKYISVNEAITIRSGEKKFLAPSKVTCHSKPPQPKIGLNVSERIPIRPTETPSFSSQQDLASGILRQSKPQRLRNMQISEVQLQQPIKLTGVKRSVSSLQHSEDPANEHVQKEQAGKVKLPQTKDRSSVKMPSNASTPSTNASPLTISGGSGCTTIELWTGNAENVNNNLLPDLEKRPLTLACDALWKGSFSIQDDYGHGKLSHKIQAHPPAQVRRKIYEFSKRMPEVLHFQLVPFKKFWINLFQGYIPDERDIGLYFFPSDGDRSEDYNFLLESISVNNLALRKQIGDVELLIFTSKLLPVHCQCWKGKYFFWGVFHHMKRDKAAHPDNKGGVELFLGPSDVANHGHNQVGGDGVVDMDVDMIGGINVGKIDVPVPREPLRAKGISFREESAAAAAVASGSDRLIQSVSRHNFDAIPPGFEETFRLRFQGSSPSFRKNVTVGKGKGKKPYGS